MREGVTEVSTGMRKCPLCGMRLVKKYNKNPRRVIALNGGYWALERVLRCRNRECLGHPMSFRSEELQAAIIPGRIFGLDVIVRIGELRYKEHKNYAKITEALEEKGIAISLGKRTNLSSTFESLLKGWHEERIHEIRAKLGLYVLSANGTYSYKDEALYIFRSYEQ
jgi:hypothetical protein